MPLLNQLKVGFVGLGLMGKPMARNLRNAGAHVVIFNRSRQVVNELAAEGFQPAGSPADVACKSSVVVCMVSDTDAVEQVIFGESGLSAGSGSGSLIMDMGTTDVMRTRALAMKLNRRGIGFVDAPVSGGELGAKEASLSIMVGASKHDFRRVRGILEVLGRRITHVGDVGNGQIAKAANQIIVGLTIGAVAEAFAFARRGGADLDKVRQALSDGFASSRILEVHGKRMISGNYEPGGKSVTQQKDLYQALEFAQHLGIRLPATEQCLNRYDELIEKGGGALDHSALFTLY